MAKLRRSYEMRETKDLGQRWEIRYVNSVGERRQLRMFSLAHATEFAMRFAFDYGLKCTVSDHYTKRVAIAVVATPKRS